MKISAFPGANGFGKYIKGARNSKGADVYLVSNLKDSGWGSLRSALEATGPRYIVPIVSGVIFLSKDIEVFGYGNFTVLGQLAPFPGITIANAGIRLQDGADNFIIRYIRARVGDARAGKRNVRALTLRNVRGGMIDHCSFSWAMDENVCFHPSGGPDWEKEGISFQFNTVAEPLNKVVGGYEVDEHGFNMLVDGNNISYHHNLIAHAASRNPQWFDRGATRSFDKDLFGLNDFRNNLIFNYQYPMRGNLVPLNIINNLFVPGPRGGKDTNRFYHRPDITKGDETSTIYANGNEVDGYDACLKDNRLAIRANGVDGEPLTEARMRSRPHLVSEDVYDFNYDCRTSADLILKSAGMSFYRDLHDQRYMRNVKENSFDFPGSNGSHSGVIDSQKDVGGWWQPNAEKKIVDVDGIPINWKRENNLEVGKNVANDYTLSKEYPNIEFYANELVNS